ncbi:VOC family protein [Ureibacillus aquaedulcis]|uniref:VOC family protein n=1 Tax=Ureibacillus aquaedulcis TaxID=3058421 RepID=A0ABT8GQW0_9BACL|nr:VOC family protein [Ureibacillus sp. BA0131]MDN4493788.1 VOC family protein [Ureibacillus sp. BA0131]
MYLLDHLVHFVEKPEKLVETTREHGIHTVNGGKHEMWGTYNSLCYFELSYIEFIGIFDEALFEKSALEPFTLHETYKKKNFQNGVVRIALRTENIEKAAENLRLLSYEVHGPEKFSRTRPDGTILKWKLLHFGKTGQSLDFPFVIQWDGDDDQRFQELVESGVIKPHPIGDLQIKEIEIEVGDLSIAAEWGKVFGLEVEGTDSIRTIKIANCELKFKAVDGNNKISQITISGAQEEKELIIEGTSYLFKD